MRTDCGGIGFPAPASASDFHPGPRGFSVRRPPHLSMGFHPPSSFPPPPESCGLRAALRAWLDLATQPSSRRAPPLGSASLIAASTTGVHHPARNPNPAVKFRPRRFSRPRRFAPPIAFAGLFHPAATSRVCPSGVCPSPRSRTGFPRPSHALLTLGAPACDQRMRPRLQGLAPRRECGADRDGLGPDRSAPLVGFPLLRVLPPRNLGMPSHPLRPQPSPRRTPRGWFPASCGCADWLAWDQAADPLELPGLNPRPSFRKVGFEATFPAVHRAAGHAKT